jgi:hypothetical protein
MMVPVHLFTRSPVHQVLKKAALIPAAFSNPGRNIKMNHFNISTILSLDNIIRYLSQFQNAAHF